MRSWETPTKRRNPSEEIVWVATGRNDKRRVAKLRWNGGKGTFDLKREAQQAIDEYFATWPTHHPRSERTNETTGTAQLRPRGGGRRHPPEAIAEDATTDEVADLNPFKGVRV
jgi:hypothetical protein